MLCDYTSATESNKRALNIRQKELGEDHENTAHSYFNLGITQYVLTDNNLATQSHKRALNIRQKALGEDHENTADSYFNLHHMCDVNAKCSNQYIQSEQRKYHQETTRTEAWEKN